MLLVINHYYSVTIINNVLFSVMKHYFHCSSRLCFNLQWNRLTTSKHSPAQNVNGKKAIKKNDYWLYKHASTLWTHFIYINGIIGTKSVVAGEFIFTKELEFCKTSFFIL